jgi:sucrose-6-phosphate hydrolase SacC (GH32 family)
MVCTGCTPYATFTLPTAESKGPKGPFVWRARAEPVIARGAFEDVLNPSVVQFHGQYWNLYSEFESGAWHTAAATSADGVTWERKGRVLSPSGTARYIAANGTALVVGEEIFYWYEVGYPLKLALARSRDGLTWTQTGIVLDVGPYRSFDESAVADPYVIRAGDFYYLYYLGQDRAVQQRLGVARSRDGVVWEKYAENPVLTGVSGAFDEELGEPAVWTSGGQWWMLYTGRARNEVRKLGLAQSNDGVHWTRVPDFVIEGSEAWSRKVIADPTVEVRENDVRVWFGGGDVASPDQRLHGQIGVGVLQTRR